MDPSFQKIEEFLTSRNIGYLLSAFVVNKIDDNCAGSVDTQKLISMGLAYGDVIMYRQAFVDKESIPSYKQRCEELKQTLKRTRQQEPEGEAIKTLNVSIGLKCKEKSGTSKSIKYTLKNNKSYTNDVSKKMSCEELHKMVREHYMISPARKTYLGLYDESSIQKLTVEQVYAQQKQKKKALAVYLYYPKSYADLEFKKMVDMDYSRFSSDEDDYPAFQSSNRSLPVISNITQSEAIQQEVNTLSPPESSTMPQTEVIGQEAYTLTLPGCSTVSQSEAVQQETNTLSLPGSSRSDIDNSNIGFQGRATRTRERREPIRYRHSIGSPSYSVQDTRSDEQQNSTDPSFGAEETERFFLNLKGTTTPTDRADCEEVIEAQEFPRNMQAAYDEYINRPKKSKTVLAQRDTRYFWNILFRQNFDLASEDVKVRFAGEAAADDGGPLKEFLTLSMKIFKECNLCFGNKECALRSSPDDPENRFYKLGQITGLSILITGRGPECLHPAVVRAIFDVDQPQEIEPIEDGLINERIDEIKNGLYEALYEQNINPSNKTTNELIRLFLISAIVNSHFFAIHKFRSGIISISPNILDCSNFESNKKCLEYSTAVEYTFEEMISLFIYPQTTNLDADEATSNFMDRIRIAISEFELFLLDVGHGNVIIEDETLLTFHDILLLLTGCDRIPPSGLEKKIEVFFADDISYPKISTCGLIFTLPIQTKNFQTMMVNSVKFGGVGFGDI